MLHEPHKSWKVFGTSDFFTKLTGVLISRSQFLWKVLLTTEMENIISVFTTPSSILIILQLIFFFFFCCCFHREKTSKTFYGIDKNINSVSYIPTSFGKKSTDVEWKLATDFAFRKSLTFQLGRYLKINASEILLEGN